MFSQKRITKSLPEEVTTEIQKCSPSLQTPFGLVPAPKSRLPSGVRLLAFHNETECVMKLVTMIRSPSKAAAWLEPPSPLPVRVANNRAGVEVLTTLREVE